jgi:hypothetical protein
MSRKQCKRKVWPLLDPLRHALEGVRVTDKPALDKLRLIELSALEAFAKGNATAHDWSILSNLLNVSEQMAVDGIWPEALETNLEAQQAMKAANQRPKFGFSGPELQTIRLAYAYADRQRTSITRSQFEEEIRRTKSSIARAIASGKAEIVQVNQGASA